MGLDEEGALAQLRAHRRALIDPKIEEHHGRIVTTTGDGMLVEFASVVDEVRCAVKVQRSMADRNAGVPQDKRIEFRVGIMPAGRLLRLLSPRVIADCPSDGRLTRRSPIARGHRHCGIASSRRGPLPRRR